MRAVLFVLVLGLAIAVLVRELFGEAARRARRHELEVAQRQREKAADQEVGGSAELPILVPTSSVVETEAANHRCVRCDGPMRVTDHVAQTVGEERLRVVTLRCGRCGTTRELYFRIGLPS